MLWKVVEGVGLALDYGVRAGCEWVHTQIRRGQWEVWMQWIVVWNGKRNPFDCFTKTEHRTSNTRLHSVSLVYV